MSEQNDMSRWSIWMVEIKATIKWHLYIQWYTNWLIARLPVWLEYVQCHVYIGYRWCHHCSPKAAAPSKNLFDLDHHVLGVGVLTQNGEVWSDSVHHRFPLACSGIVNVMCRREGGGEGRGEEGRQGRGRLGNEGRWEREGGGRRVASAKGERK